MLDAHSDAGERLVISAQVVTSGLFVVMFTVIATLTVGSLAFPANNLSISVGEVAPFDIRAPVDITFESSVLTEQARQDIVSSVSNVYTTDNEITRHQVNQARLILDYIEHVRRDSFATRTQQRSDLIAIDEIELENQAIPAILGLSDSDWQRVRDQVSLVLSNVMSGEVRQDSLQDIYESIPRRSVLFPEDLEKIITALVLDLIRPNTFVDPEATDAVRESAGSSVAPVIRSFQAGEMVVQQGQVISALDVETLSKLGLLGNGQDIGPVLAAAFIAVLLVEVMIGLYLNRFRPRMLLDIQTIMQLGVLFLVALILARMILTFDSNEVFPYLYPTAALAILITGLAGPQLAIVMALALSLLVGIIAGGVEFTAMIAFSSVISVIYLRRTERINAFFKAGTLAGIINAGVVLAFGIVDFNPDVLMLLSQAATGLVGGLLSAAIALMALFVMGSAFNVTTGLLLSELARSDHPLMQRLMREAPGTYQHSLMVANLAEAAAEQIDANTLLVRVGALYHDIGKMHHPTIFIENQAYGDHSIHERLSPKESAHAIIDHVIVGDQMARKSRLPKAIRDFILEHHGTTMPSIFWHKALEAVGGDADRLNRADFTYPGPKPQSRETAIVMICDSCESAMRAVRPTNQQEIIDLVNKIINGKMNMGQLDQCDLTLRDLDHIRETIVSSLKGVFHQRPVYPAEKSSAKDQQASPGEAAEGSAPTAAEVKAELP